MSRLKVDRRRPGAAEQELAMSLTADDLRPLVAKLSLRERLRLARLVLTRPGMTGAQGAAAGHRLRAVGPDELRTTADADPLAWEADGWEEFQ